MADGRRRRRRVDEQRGAVCIERKWRRSWFGGQLAFSSGLSNLGNSGRITIGVGISTKGRGGSVHVIVGSGTSGVGAISTIVSGRGSARGGGPTAVVSREDVLASSGIISVTSTNGGASGGSGRLAFSSGSAVTGNTGDGHGFRLGDSRPRREDGLARGKRDKRRGESNHGACGKRKRT